MDIEDWSDEQIVQSILQGETERFRIIVRRYQEKIFNIGMRFFRNEFDSNDFVQDVFIRAYGNLGSYREKAPFRYWLTRIAYNRGIDVAGAVKPERDIAGEGPETHDPSPEKLHVRGEVRDMLMSAVDKLPEKYRICLDFYFFLGLSYSEIFEITGIPINTVKSNVLRAKKILRNSLRGTIAEDYNEM